MKPLQLFNRLLGLLIIGGAIMYASPAGGTSQSGAPVSVLSDVQARSTSLGLVNTFNQTSGLEPVTLETIIPSQFYHQLQEEGTVALVTKEALSHLNGSEYWSMVVGREVIVPVMNISHPGSGEITQNGISPEGFRKILAGQGNLYYTGSPGTEALLADFLGVTAEEIRAGSVSDVRQLMALLGENREAIGFCPITSIIDPEALTLATDVSLVPIDLNGSGALEHAEDFYRSGPDLVRAIVIGKYPRTLYTRLYAVTAHQPSSEGEMTFLEWLAGEGQANLSSYGWMGLTLAERPSVLNHIRDRQPLLAEQQIAPAGNSAVLIICGFLLALVVVVLLVLNRLSIRPDSPVSGNTAPGPAGEYATSFPAGFFFDRSHTWTYLEKSGQVKVGLDQFLLHVTGAVTRVEMKAPGTFIRKGEPLMSIVQQGKKLVINAPLTGVVSSCNESVQSHPDRILNSPYEQGWIYLIEPEHWLSELRSYFLGDRYRAWLKEEMSRLKDFFSRGISMAAGAVPSPVIQDGGEIRYGILEEFGPEVWEEFQVRFINGRV